MVFRTQRTLYNIKLSQINRNYWKVNTKIQHYESPSGFIQYVDKNIFFFLFVLPVSYVTCNVINGKELNVTSGKKQQNNSQNKYITK